MLQFTACPLCLSTTLSQFLTCQDHTVSHETFQLEKCSTCGFVLTNPQPDEITLPRYYQSDEYISHSSTAKNLIDHIYKISRNFTLRWKYRLINKHSLSKPSSVLDYGCGTGAFLAECKNHHLEIAGVEPSETARRVAAVNTDTEILKSLTQVHQKFDVVTLWHVLEHVSDLHGTVESLKTCLQENGTMFIAVPNHRSADALQFGEYWAGYDVPRHLWHFSRDTMERLLNTHHLNLANVIPMPLDAYYVSLLSGKYKTGKKNTVASMIEAVARGWQSNRAARKSKEFSSLIYIVHK